MRKTLNSIVITVAKISLKSSIWKYVYKLFMNYKLVQLYENEKFNWDQCGKYFARRCNLKVLIQNVHEIEKIRYESINDLTSWKRSGLSEIYKIQM